MTSLTPGISLDLWKNPSREDQKSLYWWIPALSTETEEAGRGKFKKCPHLGKEEVSNAEISLQSRLTEHTGKKKFIKERDQARQE